MKPRTCTTATACRIVGVSPTHLRRLEESGALNPTRAKNGPRCFDVEEVEQLAAKRAENRAARGAEVAAWSTPVASPSTARTASDEPEPLTTRTTPSVAPGGITLTAAQVAEVRELFDSKIRDGAALVARCRAAVEDYAALEADHRELERRLADRVVEFDELKSKDAAR